MLNKINFSNIHTAFIEKYFSSKIILLFLISLNKYEHETRIVSSFRFILKKMLDLFTIFSKGGIVLWYFQGTTQLFTNSVNELIKSVILQVIQTVTVFF